METTSTNKNFLMINYNLLSSQTITSTEKIFISYILGWQSDNKICFESNPSLAKKIGMATRGLEKLIYKMNIKYDFFLNEAASPSMHNLSIDINLLEKFLNQSNTIDLNEDNLKMVSKPIQEELVTEIDSIEVTEPKPEVKIDIIISKIKASDIPRPSVQVKVVDVIPPVIKNKVDSIDLGNFNMNSLRLYDEKYLYENTKVTVNNYVSIFDKINRGEITFQQMLVECDEMILKIQKEKEIINNK